MQSLDHREQNCNPRNDCSNSHLCFNVLNMKGFVIHLSLFSSCFGQKPMSSKENDCTLRCDREREREWELQGDGERAREGKKELIQSNPISIQDQRKCFHRQVFLFFLPSRSPLFLKNTASECCTKSCVRCHSSFRLGQGHLKRLCEGALKKECTSAEPANFQWRPIFFHVVTHVTVGTGSLMFKTPLPPAVSYRVCCAR